MNLDTILHILAYEQDNPDKEPYSTCHKCEVYYADVFLLEKDFCEYCNPVGLGPCSKCRIYAGNVQLIDKSFICGECAVKLGIKFW